MFIKKFTYTLLLLLSVTSIACAKPVLNIKHWTLKNGAQVYFVPAKQIPIVDIRVLFHAGSAYDGQHPGLAALTNNMLDQGTKAFNVNQIAATFADHGAQFGTDVARDMGLLSLRSLTARRHLEPALSLFTQILTQPTFPEKAFVRQQHNTITAIKQSEQSPSSVAAKAFYHQLYGDHPYGHAIAGNIESVQALNRQQLIKFYQQYYVANNAVVAIVGDVDLAQAKKISEQIIGKLPAGHQAKSLPETAQLKQAEVKRINFPSTQTHILIGQVAIKRNNPNYFPLYVGNYVLGGSSFLSRLFDVVRNKHAYAYAAYSYFLPMLDDGPFIISLQTKNDQARKALKVTESTFRHFVEKGPTKQELNNAKSAIIGAFPLRLDTNSAIVANIAALGFYHLPLNYFDTYRNKIKHVTRQEIVKAFSQVIHPKQMLTILVGKQSGHA